jgi:hypothetical protein
VRAQESEPEACRVRQLYQNLLAKHWTDRDGRLHPIEVGDIVGAFVAFLLGGALFSQQAEARCWWNGYNHCRYYNHGWWYHSWYHHGYWYR